MRQRKKICALVLVLAMFVSGFGNGGASFISYAQEAEGMSEETGGLSPAENAIKQEVQQTEEKTAEEEKAEEEKTIEEEKTTEEKTIEDELQEENKEEVQPNEGETDESGEKNEGDSAAVSGNDVENPESAEESEGNSTEGEERSYVVSFSITGDGVVTDSDGDKIESVTVAAGEPAEFKAVPQTEGAKVSVILDGEELEAADYGGYHLIPEADTEVLVDFETAADDVSGNSIRRSMGLEASSEQRYDVEFAVELDGEIGEETYFETRFNDRRVYTPANSARIMVNMQAPAGTYFLFGSVVYGSDDKREEADDWSSSIYEGIEVEITEGGDVIFNGEDSLTVSCKKIKKSEVTLDLNIEGEVEEGLEFEYSLYNVDKGRICGMKRINLPASGSISIKTEAVPVGNYDIYGTVLYKDSPAEDWKSSIEDGVTVEITDDGKINGEDSLVVSCEKVAWPLTLNLNVTGDVGEGIQIEYAIFGSDGTHYNDESSVISQEGTATVTTVPVPAGYYHLLINVQPMREDSSKWVTNVDNSFLVVTKDGVKIEGKKDFVIQLQQAGATGQSVVFQVKRQGKEGDAVYFEYELTDGTHIFEDKIKLEGETQTVTIENVPIGAYRLAGNLEDESGKWLEGWTCNRQEVPVWVPQDGNVTFGGKRSLTYICKEISTEVAFTVEASDGEKYPLQFQYSLNRTPGSYSFREGEVDLLSEGDRQTIILSKIPDGAYRLYGWIADENGDPIKGWNGSAKDGIDILVADEKVYYDGQSSLMVTNTYTKVYPVNVGKIEVDDKKSGKRPYLDLTLSNGTQEEITVSIEKKDGGYTAEFTGVAPGEYSLTCGNDWNWKCNIDGEIAVQVSEGGKVTFGAEKKAEAGIALTYKGNVGENDVMVDLQVIVAEGSKPLSEEKREFQIKLISTKDGKAQLSAPIYVSAAGTYTTILTEIYGANYNVETLLTDEQEDWTIPDGGSFRKYSWGAAHYEVKAIYYNPDGEKKDSHDVNFTSSFERNTEDWNWTPDFTEGYSATYQLTGKSLDGKIVERTLTAVFRDEREVKELSFTDVPTGNYKIVAVGMNKYRSPQKTTAEVYVTAKGVIFGDGRKKADLPVIYSADGDRRLTVVKDFSIFPGSGRPTGTQEFTFTMTNGEGEVWEETITCDFDGKPAGDLQTQLVIFDNMPDGTYILREKDAGENWNSCLGEEGRVIHFISMGGRATGHSFYDNISVSVRNIYSDIPVPGCPDWVEDFPEEEENRDVSFTKKIALAAGAVWPEGTASFTFRLAGYTVDDDAENLPQRFYNETAVVEFTPGVDSGKKVTFRNVPAGVYKLSEIGQPGWDTDIPETGITVYVTKTGVSFESADGETEWTVTNTWTGSGGNENPGENENPGGNETPGGNNVPGGELPGSGPDKAEADVSVQQILGEQRPVENAGQGVLGEKYGTQTGDSTPVAGWLFLLAAAALTMEESVRRLRKKKK